MKYGERSGYFRGPTALTITTISQGALTATATAPPAWMEGCSIMIEGDADMNRILEITGTTLSLLRAYRGTGTSAGATVYGDAALLGAEVSAVMLPVGGSPNLKLTEARSLEEFNRYSLRLGYNWMNDASVQDNTTPILGTPSLYYVERRRDSRLRMRVTPRPGGVFNATFQAKLRAERIDVTALALDGGEDPGYTFVSLHDDDVESVLLPIARMRFFAHPSLKNSESRAAVEKEYLETMSALRSGAVFEPSVAPVRAQHI